MADAVFGQRLDGHAFRCKFDIFKWLRFAYYWLYLHQLVHFVKLGLHFMTK